ncbi:hypothetical protein A9K55_002363 [Cordyceps militaris]|uniref:Uncharacterized protein n=1 Tax=Cordyceps militaris TaxID=73501 RepID=A0A2H4S8J2_CORMI|nr:hypothetical protein A9K55_002363 [Cordyceps militaris]
MARIFPDRSAAPKQVREYLAQLLTAKHDVPLDQATKLALRWEYGRGSDLRDSKDLDLFGTRLGDCLLKSMREDESLEWRQSTAGVLFRYATYGAISALLLSIAFAYKYPSLQTCKHGLTCAAPLSVLNTGFIPTSAVTSHGYSLRPSDGMLILHLGSTSVE